MGSMLKFVHGGAADGGRRGSDDRGSALVMAAIVSVVAFSLGGVVLSFANHQSSASSIDAQRQQAIDAASAGLVDAASALTNDAGYAGSGATPVRYDSSSATYQVTVAEVADQPFTA